MHVAKRHKNVQNYKRMRWHQDARENREKHRHKIEVTCERHPIIITIFIILA